MINIIFAANVIFTFVMQPGTNEACFKPNGGAEVCSVMVDNSKMLVVPDETLVDFYAKVDGTKGAVTSYTTPPPFFAAPTIVVER